MTRVVPPLCLEIRMRIMIRRKRKFSSRESALINETTLTLASPWQEESEK
jgi:hypothetical protein